MFKNTYQSGFLSILYSIGSKPLQIWEKESTHVAKSSSQRPHQKTYWPGHSIFCLGNHGYQRHHCLHNFPSKSKRNSRHQATLPCHDHQECTFFITQLKKYSLSKYRYLMTKMYAEDLELPTISRRLEWSPSSVLCPWGSTKAGIRFSLTCQISREEPTVATTFRRWEWQFTLTVVSEEYTFLIDFIVSKSCHQNSNCFCQSKSSNEVIRLYIIYGIASSDLQSLTFKK